MTTGPHHDYARRIELELQRWSESNAELRETVQLLRTENARLQAENQRLMSALEDTRDE